MRPLNRVIASLKKNLTSLKLDPHNKSNPSVRHYDNAASKEDILACFRLLLGRYPNVEEWTGHMMQVGDPLPQVVAGYLTSLEFSRRGLTNDISADYIVSDLPNFRIFSDTNDSAVGKFVRENIYEYDVTTAARAVLRPGMQVLDIGANIGYFAMLFASIVGPDGHVFAVEPNQQNIKLLEASRRLNTFRQITVLPFAAAAETGILALTTSHSTGTTSAIPDEISAILNARIVPCAALDTIIPGHQRIDLIKIDVDGAEYNAMLGCEKLIKRFQPTIISEFAPGLLPGISNIDGEEYLRWFGSHNYNISIIEPDGSLLPMEQRWQDVMEVYSSRCTDHIDILASPRP